MLIPDNGNKHDLLKLIRQELAQNRTDIQRLIRISERTQQHPFPIPLPQSP